MIRAIKPIEMPVFSLNEHWIPWISIILFITAHFLTKMTINDARSPKNVIYFATLIDVHCPVFTRLIAHQIVVHEGCFKEKPCHNKLRPPRLCTTWPKSLWWLGSNVRQVRDRQKKVTLFLIKYGAKSMQTFQHACSVAFFKLCVRIYITFERTIIFTLNLVVLC